MLLDPQRPARSLAQPLCLHIEAPLRLQVQTHLPQLRRGALRFLRLKRRGLWLALNSRLDEFIIYRGFTGSMAQVTVTPLFFEISA